MHALVLFSLKCLGSCVRLLKRLGPKVTLYPYVCVKRGGGLGIALMCAHVHIIWDLPEHVCERFSLGLHHLP